MNSPTPPAGPVRASGLPSPAECKRIRLAAGASLQYVGAEVGVNKVTVYRWEEGLLAPSMETGRRYRAVLEGLAEAGGTQVNGVA